MRRLPRSLRRRDRYPALPVASAGISYCFCAAAILASVGDVQAMMAILPGEETEKDPLAFPSVALADKVGDQAADADDREQGQHLRRRHCPTPSPSPIRRGKDESVGRLAVTVIRLCHVRHLRSRTRRVSFARTI